MIWVALVALLAVDSSTLGGGVVGFCSDLSLHGPHNGRLHPSGTDPVGRFLRQEVQVFGRLVGQAHGYDGLSLPHDPSEGTVHNK